MEESEGEDEEESKDGVGSTIGKKSKQRSGDGGIDGDSAVGGGGDDNDSRYTQGY